MKVPDNHDQFVDYDYRLAKINTEHSNIFCMTCGREIEFLEEYFLFENDEALCVDRHCTIDYLKTVGILKDCLPF